MSELLVSFEDCACDDDGWCAYHSSQGYPTEIRAALAAAEERATRAERERDEARASMAKAVPVIRAAREEVAALREALHRALDHRLPFAECDAPVCRAALAGSQQIAGAVKTPDGQTGADAHREQAETGKVEHPDEPGTAPAGSSPQPEPPCSACGGQRWVQSSNGPVACSQCTPGVLLASASPAPPEAQPHEDARARHNRRMGVGDV